MSEQEAPAGRPAGKLDQRFLTERQGRPFALYSGLLDLAHQEGLRAIRTQIVQIPCPDNGNVAICTAEVTTDRGTFTGIGDAAPENVSRMMVAHLLRMSETRAKARALRDAVNVGVAALEELADDDEHAQPAAQVQLQAAKPAQAARPQEAARPAAARPAQPAPAQTHNPGAIVPGDGLASPAQVRAIYTIAHELHGVAEAVADKKAVSLYGAAPAELTKKQASDFITWLKEHAPAPK